MQDTVPQEIVKRSQSWIARAACGPHATPFLILFAFAESVFFPIPVDAVLIPLVMVRARSWLYYAFLASVASVVGGVAGYVIGFFFYSLVGAPLVSFYGLESEAALAGAWLSDNAFAATFLSAFTPMPYKAFTLSAGFLNIPFLVFLFASVLGRTLRYVAVSWLTSRFGAQVVRFILQQFVVFTFSLLLGAVAGWLFMIFVF